MMRLRSTLSLSKQEKLRHSRDFREGYERGRRLTGTRLTIVFTPNRLNFNRLGLSVSKKRFKLSVRRHYIQRRLREAYRLNKSRFLQGYDIIIIARECTLALPGSYTQGPGLHARTMRTRGKVFFEDVNKELLALAQKAGLLKG